MSEQKEYRIPREAAEKQLEALYDFYDVDDEIMEAEGGEQDQLGTAVRVQRHQMLIKIMKGRLSIDGDADTGIEVTQVLRTPVAGHNELSWREPDGMARLELDKHTKGDNQRMFAFIGYMTGINKSNAAKLKGVDLSTAELLSVFFMRA